MELYEKTTVKEIKKKNNFKNSKSLGQNFLIDQDVIEAIVDGSQIKETDLVIEVGPGFGVLTAQAAKVAGKVVAIEIDSKLIPILEENLRKQDNIKLVNEDILKLDISALIAEELKENPKLTDVVVLGNLPYYITTPIIMKFLEEDVRARSITVMMQKEVADRINAVPSTKAYGALSVAVQYCCYVNKIVDVSKECFDPVPKVDSCVLRLDVRPEKAVEIIDEKSFFNLVKAAFSQRRKTLLNCLTGKIGEDKEATKKIIEDAGIDPGIRGEALGIDDFARLADTFVRENK